jgi:predicted lipoprotein with Yx(FWY)xxD motif
MVVASMGGALLMSCESGEGGIVVEPDGSGGAKGDGATDTREAGGGGGTGGSAGGNNDAAPDTVADATEDRSGDGSVPPLCVYHTPPPPLVLSLLDDSGADATDDMTSSSDAADSGSVDSGSDSGVADATVLDANGADSGPADVTLADATSADISSGDATGGGDVAGDRSGGGRDGGDAGDGAIPPSITVINSPFLGPYLADSAGRTLYTFGNDKPGDCMYSPVVDCEADCLIAWPPFDAGKRTLAPSLDPAVFGSTALADAGGQITTYYGWPIYYYRSDTTGNVINGQGKSKTWHVATVTPPNMMIMRNNNDPRYIADGTGHTLYVYDQDTAGTATSNPVSACTGTCLTSYPPFLSNKINAVSSLDPNDLSLFVRPEMGGRQQVAYKGVPLYFSAADIRSGDQLGVSMGWTVAAAP